MTYTRLAVAPTAASTRESTTAPTVVTSARPRVAATLAVRRTVWVGVGFVLSHIIVWLQTIETRWILI